MPSIATSTDPIIDEDGARAPAGQQQQQQHLRLGDVLAGFAKSGGDATPSSSLLSKSAANAPPARVRNSVRGCDNDDDDDDDDGYAADDASEEEEESDEEDEEDLSWEARANAVLKTIKSEILPNLRNNSQIAAYERRMVLSDLKTLLLERQAEVFQQQQQEEQQKLKQETGDTDGAGGVFSLTSLTGDNRGCVTISSRHSEDAEEDPLVLFATTEAFGGNAEKAAAHRRLVRTILSANEGYGNTTMATAAQTEHTSSSSPSSPQLPEIREQIQTLHRELVLALQQAHSLKSAITTVCSRAAALWRRYNYRPIDLLETRMRGFVGGDGSAAAKDGLVNDDTDGNAGDAAGVEGAREGVFCLPMTKESLSICRAVLLAWEAFDREERDERRDAEAQRGERNDVISIADNLRLAKEVELYDAILRSAANIVPQHRANISNYLVKAIRQQGAHVSSKKEEAHDPLRLSRNIIPLIRSRRMRCEVALGLGMGECRNDERAVLLSSSSSSSPSSLFLTSTSSIASGINANLLRLGKPPSREAALAVAEAGVTFLESGDNGRDAKSSATFKDGPIKLSKPQQFRSDCFRTYDTFVRQYVDRIRTLERHCEVFEQLSGIPFCLSEAAQTHLVAEGVLVCPHRGDGGESAFPPLIDVLRRMATEVLREDRSLGV